MKTRVVALDVIRGYALFGILICNMVLFAHPLEYINPYFSEHTAWYDELATFIRFSFFGDKTFTIFSLLFGVGIGMQYNKFKESQRPFQRYHITRMSLLLVIGLLHAFFIWYGDILALYAVLGMLALLFTRLAPRQLYGLALLFFLWPTMQTIMMRMGMLSLSIPHPALLPLQELEALNTAQGFEGHWQYNTSQLWGTLQYYLTGNMYTSMSMILLGIGLAKARHHETIDEDIAFYRKLFSVSILVVIIWTIYFISLFDISLMQNNVHFYGYWVIFNLSNLGQTFLVVSLIVLILHRGGWIKKLITPLRYMGRLSLTNYLLHSVFGLIIFKVVGYFGQSSPGIDLLLTLAITAIQILLSRQWIKRYGIGPIERLWRWATSQLT